MSSKLLSSLCAELMQCTAHLHDLHNINFIGHYCISMLQIHQSIMSKVPLMYLYLYSYYMYLYYMYLYYTYLYYMYLYYM